MVEKRVVLRIGYALMASSLIKEEKEGGGGAVEYRFYLEWPHLWMGLDQGFGAVLFRPRAVPYALMNGFISYGGSGGEGWR